MELAFISELIGTAILIILGNGIVANLSLKNTNAESQTPWILISSSWGLAVFVAAYITSQFSGAHLNPAVTIGLAVAKEFSWSLVPVYILAQLLGAMVGSFLVYLFYIDHYRKTTDINAIKSTFCTAPAIRNFKNNFFSEFFATFILIFGIFFLVSPNINITGTETLNYGIGSLESLPVGFLVWVIGASLGGTTGYAINPARDLGPRIVFTLLPIKREGKNSDWSYSWIPILAPCLGSIAAGISYLLLM